MQDKAFLNILIILYSLLWIYFYNYGFSKDFFVRYGQYFAMTMGAYYIIEELFRPGE